MGDLVGWEEGGVACGSKGQIVCRVKRVTSGGPVIAAGSQRVDTKQCLQQANAQGRTLSIHPPHIVPELYGIGNRAAGTCTDHAGHRQIRALLLP